MLRLLDSVFRQNDAKGYFGTTSYDISIDNTKKVYPYPCRGHTIFLPMF